MPAEWLFPKTRWSILKALFWRPDRDLNVNELIRLAGGGAAHVQRELKQFASSGLLTRSRSGNQVRYKANPAHPLFPDLRALVVKTVGLVDELRQRLASLRGVEVAFVYGSVVTGQDRADSDVDVMIIGSIGLREAVAALSPAQSELGRPINPTVYTPREFAEKFGAGNPFLAQVAAGPKLFLIGDEHDLERMGRPPQGRSSRRGRSSAGDRKPAARRRTRS